MRTHTRARERAANLVKGAARPFGEREEERGGGRAGRLRSLALPLRLAAPFASFPRYAHNIGHETGFFVLMPITHDICTSQQKVDTFFKFYTLKTGHSTPYTV